MAGSFYERLLQKLALSLILLCLIGPFIYWPLVIALFILNPLYGLVRGLIILYLAWVFILDKDAHNQPSGITPVRRLRIWHYLAAYFPAKLIKTSDIDPKGNYIFCGHPHGIACFSYVANFFVEGTGFSQLFPGINLFPIILDAHFFAPIHREISLWSGFRGNSKRAFVNLLNGAGNSIFLVPGGSPEVMRASPGTYDLILNKRKGFVKMALMTGSHLVPIIGFGETDLFEVNAPKPGSLVDSLQKIVFKLTSFAFPVLTGAGFWSGTGPLPRSLPLTTVVGSPVQVDKWEGSVSGPEFNAAVDKLHSRYVKALKDLWNENKDRYGKERRRSLNIVE